MKIYTRTGDRGQTSLFGGTRVAKHHIRIEVFGTIDELNAHLGLLRSMDILPLYQEMLVQIQQDLFRIGSELALEPEKAILKNGKERLRISKIRARQVETLEQWIDQMTLELPPLKNFIIPGGHPAVAECHIARTVCRRAERKATLLYEQTPFNDSLLQYLNRLSDLLFTLARIVSRTHQVEEIPVMMTRE